MKKILSLVLLCATVLFASCKDDDDNNKQNTPDTPDTPDVPEAYTGPDFKMYGHKNFRLAYYDGKELKFLTNDHSLLNFGGAVGDDFYGVSSSGDLFYKNGEVTSKEGKIPADASRISDFRIIAGTFYVLGDDKSNDSKTTIWKNGTKLFNSDKSGLSAFCVVGNDIFWTVSVSKNSIYTTDIYKNNDKIGQIEAKGYARYIQVYNDKVYITTANSDAQRFVYDGTSVSEEITLTNTFCNFFYASGSSLYTTLKTNGISSFYKNLDWSTPISLTIPEGAQTLYNVNSVVEEGNDTYVYGACNLGKSRIKGYVWRNSKDPISLPMDSIYVVHQLK